MKLLSTGDFLRYNTPCFICNNEKSDILLIIEDVRKTNKIWLPPNSLINNQLSFILHFGYSNSLNLSMNLKNSGFLSSNFKGLSKFLLNNIMQINKKCTVCNTQFTSSELKFDFIKLKANPIYIVEEDIYMNKYVIQTDNNIEKTTINPYGYSAKHLITDNLYMSHEVYKTKEDYLKKIKIIEIFQ